MNPGILTPPTQFATMPRGLLGSPTPVPMPHGMTWIHPEALDWCARVVTNGGRVSSATLAAVSNFCVSVDTAGLRSALIRCNLFCGSNLAAARTPLYLSGSFGGNVVGNTTDTNVGPFVEDDYQETGSLGGLKGNGTSKALLTGFRTNSLASGNSFHLSVSATSLTTNSGSRIMIGAYIGSGSAIIALDEFAAYLFPTGRSFRCGESGAASVVRASEDPAEAHIIGTKTASNFAAIYRPSGLVASNTTTQTTPSYSFGMAVFAGAQGDSTRILFSTARMRMYSIGNGLSATQAAAFSAAVVAFNTALSRA